MAEKKRKKIKSIEARAAKIRALRIQNSGTFFIVFLSGYHPQGVKITHTKFDQE